MASVKVNYGKNGEIISYRLRADLGRDPNGKQVIQTKTIKSTGKQTLDFVSKFRYNIDT